MTAERRFQRIKRRAPRELRDLSHEALNSTIHLTLEVVHSFLTQVQK